MEITDTVYAVILGIIQGLTEFLPVSSSGHLIVVSSLVDGKPLPIALNIALHVGTLAAVLIYFWRSWVELAQGFMGRILRGEKSFESQTLLPALVLGSVPAGVIGLLWKDDIRAMFHHPSSVVLPLIVVGFFLWFADKRSPHNKNLKSLTIMDGVIIGVAQACALIPGVSRSGATTIAGRTLGFTREDAAKFSFLLGTPAMGGAALLYGKELVAHAQDPIFIIGGLVSCLVGCFAIRFFIGFIKKYGFGVFAIYRLILAIAIYVLFDER